MDDKPVIRLIHHLPRSGGTVISKCLGAMENTVLLSEVNPNADPDWNESSPIFQASFWFRLFGVSDGFALRAGGIEFADAIEFIYLKALQRGDRLILRDWTHLDFLGKPYHATPSMRLSLADVLADRFTVKQVATVRHPLDQWLSWENYRQANTVQHNFSFDEFIHACRLFAEQAARIGFWRYEDFVADRDAAITGMCAQLDMPVDPRYATLWMYFRTISGDREGTRAESTIAKLERRTISNSVPANLGGHEDYQRTLEILGYDR